MLRLFFSTHGKFASGIKSTLGILVGKTDNLTCFDAYLDEQSVQENLDRFFQSVQPDDQVILLSDLYGGSVNAAMLPYIERQNTTLITGVNLALILELTTKEQVTESELSEIVENSRMMLRIVKTEEISEDKEDFF